MKLTLILNSDDANMTGVIALEDVQELVEMHVPPDWDAEALLLRVMKAISPESLNKSKRHQKPSE